MINHLDVKVTDLLKAKNFYKAVLSSLGYKINIQKESNVSFSDSISNDPGGDFYLSLGQPYKNHFAFQASTHDQVEKFYEKALEMGAVDNGKPGYRPHYHKTYFACYVYDFDGYPIECVCHE